MVSLTDASEAKIQNATKILKQTIERMVISNNCEQVDDQIKENTLLHNFKRGKNRMFIYEFVSFSPYIQAITLAVLVTGIMLCE